MPSADEALPSGGQTLQKAFEALVTTLDQRGIRYALIGGLATLQHTRVRATDDIDVLLTIPQLAMPGLFDALKERGFSIDLNTNIREFHDEGLTVIRFGDVVVDLLRPVVPAYDHVLDRAISAQVLGRQVRVSSAEGLIVMKLIAMRPHDESDVQDILTAYGGRLDLGFIRAELDTFTEPDDSRRAKFEMWATQAALNSPA